MIGYYIECQGCRRLLAPLRDGTSRDHNTTRGGSNGYRCPSSGYRLARWEVGQRLRHHSGDLWLVAEDLGGQWGDYLMRCLAGNEKGREMVAHGEYMHRDGWTAVDS